MSKIAMDSGLAGFSDWVKNITNNASQSDSIEASSAMLIENTEYGVKQSNDSVQGEQIKMLVAQIPVGVIMQFLLASFITITFGEIIPRQEIVVWWVIAISIFLAQYSLFFFYHQKAGRISHYRYWQYSFLMLCGIGGLCWGLGITWMLSISASELNIFLFIIAISLASAAITLSVRKIVYYAFQIAVLGPVIIWLMSQGHQLNLTIGIFLVIFMVAMWIFANQVNRSITDSFHLHIVNKSLASSLKHSNARLQVLNEELMQLSATDMLTQVANRRYFEERLNNEILRSHREKIPVSLIMIDVDFFKNYNDTLGHPEGDDCLKRLAICIRDSLKRPTDIVARYGGEEFVVLLTNTSTDGAMQVANEIRNNVEKLKLPHPASGVSDFVSISLGVSGAEPEDTIIRETLIKKADQALYKAKANGRNRVEYLSYAESE